MYQNCFGVVKQGREIPSLLFANCNKKEEKEESPHPYA
jgi:hypothetical protein